MATQSAYDQNMANRKIIEDNLKKPGAVTINGLPTVNEPPPKLTTPTFDANTYYNNQAGQLTDLSSKQKELTLAQYRQARDKSIGGINDLKKDVAPAYQQSRDQADFQSRQAAQRLREMMASRGTYDGGENVTAQVANNATLQRGLNDLNLQERKTIDTYDKQIADLLDPSQEQNIISQSDIELLRQLADLRGRADDRQYDNDWRTADFTRQGLWHDDETAFRDKQFDYGKSQDTLANSWKARDWQHGLDREKIDDSRYADDKAYARKMDAIQLARSGGSGGGGRRSGGGSRGGSSKSSGGGGYIDIHKTLAAGNKYFDSLPGDKYNSYGQKTSNGVGTATKAALKNEYNQALQRYSGKDGYAKFQAEKAAIRKAQPDTADYLINALENAFAYRK